MAQLVFSDTTNRQGILQEIERMTGLGALGITGDATKLQDFTRLVNIWDGRITLDILLSDGKWQYDDHNIGDLPIATTDLKIGQQDYSVRTDDNSREIWKVSRVDIKDASGTWKQIKQTDQSEIPDGFYAYKSTNGEPNEFDWNGVSMLLFPAPSYNSTNGLKILFQRESDPFSSTGDDSKVPGFISAFHYLLALGPAYEFARDNGKKNVRILREELKQGRMELREFYSSRNAQKQGLRATQENTR